MQKGVTGQNQVTIHRIPPKFVGHKGHAVLCCALLDPVCLSHRTRHILLHKAHAWQVTCPAFPYLNTTSPASYHNHCLCGPNTMMAEPLRQNQGNIQWDLPRGPQVAESPHKHLVVLSRHEPPYHRNKDCSASCHVCTAGAMLLALPRGLSDGRWSAQGPTAPLISLSSPKHILLVLNLPSTTCYDM